MTLELNLKTNQGASDYAEGLALHFNYKSTSDESALKSKYRSEACCKKWGYGSGQAALYINRHEYYLLLYADYCTISSDLFRILFNRATWVVYKWVNWCQRYQKVLLYVNQHIGTFIFMSFCWIHVQLVSVSGLCLPKYNLKKWEMAKHDMELKESKSKAKPKLNISAG